MAILDFTLRLVTPALIAGVEEKDETYIDKNGNQHKTTHKIIGPEGDGLRIPSLKGVMRFWYRALHADMSIEILNISENRLFGSIDTGQGVRIIPRGKANFNVGPVYGMVGGAESYLGYGPVGYDGKQKNDKKAHSYNKNAYRDAINHGSEFSFRILGTDNQLKEIEQILKILHLFGGVGSRTRRGFGSLSVFKNKAVMIPYNHAIKIEDWFKQELAGIYTIPGLRNPVYSAFSQDTKITLFTNNGNPYLNYKDVWNAFLDKFKTIRNYNIPSSIGFSDHAMEFKDAKSTTVSGIPKRLAFGMPYHPSHYQSWDIEYIVDGHSRRASPLILKVLEIDKNKYIGVALFLKGTFFGEGNLDIGAKADNGLKALSGKKSFPGYQAIDEFMKLTTSHLVVY